MSRRPSIEPYHQSTSWSLYRGDVLEVLKSIDSKSIDVVFADPPYLLSNGGVTCQSGRMVSVNKGEWDSSKGFAADYAWHRSWLRACRRVLKDEGTIWVSGTYHNIYLVGHAMQSLGFRMLNDIAWLKPNAAPNLGCRCFTHSHETVLWASKSSSARHTFNYEEMKADNGGKQMRSYWTFTTPKASEKSHGKHPTQKPLALLDRIVRASTNPGEMVLDPFVGSGTTGAAAVRNGRRFIGIDANAEYLDLAFKRISAEGERLL